MEPCLAREKTELVALAALPGIHSKQLGDLLTVYGSPAGAWEALRSGRAGAGDGASTMRQWCHLAAEMEPAAVTSDMRQAGIESLVRGEAAFPERLMQLAQPPFVLFACGDLSTAALPSVAVVGARKATTYGEAMARSIAGDLACSGLVVVSGAAYGVDQAAHRGALDADRPTVAVLGCGPDIVYPPSAARLYEEIAANGCLLSEYPPGSSPLKPNFPARNRIIAALSLGVVVVEAAQTSGALLTADHALALGREVMAVPGQALSPTSRGTHGLIRHGAALVTCAADVLCELGLPSVPAMPEGAAAEGHPGATALLEALAGGQQRVDELAVHAGITAAEALAMLARLEVEGRVKPGRGGCFQLVPAERGRRPTAR